MVERCGSLFPQQFHHSSDLRIGRARRYFVDRSVGPDRISRGGGKPAAHSAISRSFVAGQSRLLLRPPSSPYSAVSLAAARDPSQRGGNGLAGGGAASSARSGNRTNLYYYPAVYLRVHQGDARRLYCLCRNPGNFHPRKHPPQFRPVEVGHRHTRVSPLASLESSGGLQQELCGRNAVP